MPNPQAADGVGGAACAGGGTGWDWGWDWDWDWAGVREQAAGRSPDTLARS
jgi:hypothetical protein